MYTVIRFSGGKSQRVLQALESKSLAVCKMFALTKTTGKGHTTVFNEDGKAIYQVFGNPDGYPKVVEID